MLGIKHRSPIERTEKGKNQKKIPRYMEWSESFLYKESFNSSEGFGSIELPKGRGKCSAGLANIRMKFPCQLFHWNLKNRASRGEFEESYCVELPSPITI